MSKCKKGQTKVGQVCVKKNISRRIKKMSNEYKILKLAIIGALSSIGGWSIFSGIVKITKLDTFPWWAMIIIGFAVIIIVYKFGFAKIK